MIPAAGNSASPAPSGTIDKNNPPNSTTPANSPAAINPATKKKEITAVQAAKAKAMNVFTNDGSFLERFKKMKEEEVEKKKQREALARKQAFEQRIKNRGKRSVEKTEVESSSSASQPNKKSKTEDEENAYLREVRKLQGHSLRDEGAGVRALVK
ncbi:hypothetical protein PPACK8108_LOCUS4418 [Phakopsora pachyrhizi]|uniref:Uncharacterized protein n=1 Tax=Phakopsora pachyrhizi TaxID=170000 RepID=A0AAV0APN1_PHAPC|nr:hypothetical protein PPACK8108_LOCUS4196 [Phakopsora pachyrhizi]CAH7669777.1 hypothetical protein PPACK8108_LOCUS4418 [Phakopsora pachyrhizi]